MESHGILIGIPYIIIYRVNVFWKVYHEGNYGYPGTNNMYNIRVWLFYDPPIPPLTHPPLRKKRAITNSFLEKYILTLIQSVNMFDQPNYHRSAL